MDTEALESGRYTYKARKMNGQLIEGDLHAASLAEARQQVLEQGLIPIDVKVWGQPNLKDWREWFVKVPLKDLMIFTQQLQTVYSVGVPIVDGLKLIEEQTENRHLSQVVGHLAKDVAAGASLATAMAKHPRVFSDIYVNMVTVGESSGQLEEILARLYFVIESQAENRQRIQSAMFYPKMVVGMIFLVFAVMVIFVIPRLQGFYESMGAGELPLPTRIVLGTSQFVTGNLFMIGIFLVGGYILFRRWVKTQRGGYLWDSAKLKLPIIGQLIIEIEMNTFCVILEMLVRSGLGIVKSLEVLTGTLQNKVVRADVEACRKHTIGGGRMGDSLKASKTFPKMLSGLVLVGEETGSMEKVLGKSARYFQSQIDYKVSNLSKAIEPILLAITFSFVLLLALAIFLPIWKMSSAMRR